MAGRRLISILNILTIAFCLSDVITVMAYLRVLLCPLLFVTIWTTWVKFTYREVSGGSHVIARFNIKDKDLRPTAVW